MSGYEITCANRNHRGIITRIAGAGWSLSIPEAVMKLLTQQIKLTILADGKLQEVGIRGEGSDAYLVINTTDFPLHDLDSLQSCGSHAFQ